MVEGKVKVTKEDIEEARKEWEATLIGVSIGSPLTVPFLRKYAEENWEGEIPEICIKENGVIIFRFKKIEDRDFVMSKGPWIIGGSEH